MKTTTYIKSCVFAFTVFGYLFLSNIQAQQTNTGPRFGITVLTPGLLGDILNGDREIGDEGEVNYTQREAVMSQFGWQWETIIKEGEDFSGVVEWIGFVGGLESGKIVPSISSLLGIRKNSGFEIAMGPTASLTGIGLVIGAGHTFKSGDLNVPINIAWVPTRTNHFLGKPESGDKIESGHGITLTVGFNFNK